ncbi:hypothetical protein EVAR_99192_1 [Eumeta japonica]|uniref:Uncharacterized protein n=1 Tax=Eumeta variegata TaxID=151549 RepID=A0A4C1YPS6_EUMVA|nr:hypothetical protein EVAR_99192_1 [Eumeta japonica]
MTKPAIDTYCHSNHDVFQTTTSSDITVLISVFQRHATYITQGLHLHCINSTFTLLRPHPSCPAERIRVYIVKDDMSTLPEARKKWYSTHRREQHHHRPDLIKGAVSSPPSESALSRPTPTPCCEWSMVLRDCDNN